MDIVTLALAKSNTSFSAQVNELSIDTLNTNDKTVVGAINELKSGSGDIKFRLDGTTLYIRTDGVDA